MIKIANESSEVVEEFRHTLSEFNYNAKEVQRISGTTENKIFAILIKIDHTLLKATALESILKREEIVPPPFSDHNSCRMDKLYHNDGVFW